jgi:hypothetical protein
MRKPSPFTPAQKLPDHGVGESRGLGRGSVPGAERMTGVFIILGGMVAFATVIGVMDLLAERHDRAMRGQARHDDPSLETDT